jgi:GT2 family glycosyltransferase
MIFKVLVTDIKKVIKVIRIDGLYALVRIIHYKLVTSLNWKQGNFFRLTDPASQQILKRYKLVIFTGEMYEAIGCNQRASQLTRAAIRTGIQVLYIHAVPKREVNTPYRKVSKVKQPNLIHNNIKELTLQEFLKFADKNTSVIFELPHPLFVDYLEISQVRGIRTVFELVNNWSTGRAGNWFREDIFQQFITGVDLVIGTSKELTDKLVTMGRRDAVYLPNAANEYIFEQCQQYKKPVDLPPGRVALTIGSLCSEWFAWEYIKEAASINSDINYCFLSHKPTAITGIFQQNIYFLGEKQHEEIPSYLSAAEFCLLPLITDNEPDVSPINIFEYIFMAKPVVSTELQEVKDLPLVFTASNENEFADLCRKMKDINIKIETEQNKIDQFISKNSWFSRLQMIIDLKGQQNVSVVILIHNNRDIIGRCLQSLIGNCSSYLSDIVVVDNASDDGGGDYVLEKFPMAKLVRNPVNGCSSGRNLGAKNSSGKYVAFFDSDQWFTSGFCFAEALCILRQHVDVGAVGWAGGWFNMDDENIAGPVVDYFPNRARNVETFIKGFRTDVPYLSTAGLFVPRTIFEATGGFDPVYDPTCFEDTDFSFAIRRLGFEIAYRDLTGIRHEAHQTTKSSEKSPEYRELFSRNSKYFLNKWKDYRDYFSEKTKWKF